MSLRGRHILRVFCAADDEYRAVYFSFRPMAYNFIFILMRKRLTLGIRGLDVESDPDEVADELRQLGSLFTTYGPRRKLLLLRVIMQKGELADRLLELTSPWSSKIKVERSRESGHIPQCHRCQRFSYGSGRFHNEVACVRCGKTHPTQQCRVPAKGLYKLRRASLGEQQMMCNFSSTYVAGCGQG